MKIYSIDEINDFKRELRLNEIELKYLITRYKNENTEHKISKQEDKIKELKEKNSHLLIII